MADPIPPEMFPHTPGLPDPNRPHPMFDGQRRDTPIPPAPRSDRSGWWTGAGAIGLAILAKWKFILVALQGLKFTKLFFTFGSMVLMIWFEAMRGGWPFGVGFVLLLLLHELGHGFAIKRAGLDAGYPVFIPFFGAMIALKGQPRSSHEEAKIAIAGPVAGAVGALLCFVVWGLTDVRIFLSLAYTTCFLNLFNLTPVPPLDGGRVAAMFSRSMWIGGVIVLVGMFFLTWAPQLVLIFILALTYGFRRAKQVEGPDEAAVTLGHRRWMAVQYFGLAALLAGGFAVSRGFLSA